MNDELPAEAHRAPAAPDPGATPPANARSAPPGAPRKPKIGDTMPAPSRPAQGGSTPPSGPAGEGDGSRNRRRRRRRGGSGAGGGGGDAVTGDKSATPPAGGAGRDERAGSGKAGGGAVGAKVPDSSGEMPQPEPGGQAGSSRNRSRNRRRRQSPVQTSAGDLEAVELDEEVLEQRRGQYKDGRALGRYQMLVHVGPDATHIAVLEGRSLVEHYVARPSDDVFQIHGNIYVGRVENVLPGMEAAFIDIATPKNAVLYRSDVAWDPEDVEGVQPGEQPRIEQVLKDRQLVVCQVTKNPIAHKGARLTQEVSIPGRFVVFVPNSRTVGISKRLPDDERKRLRRILDKARPEGHGLIVRTAAEGVTAEEIERDVRHLSAQWAEIDKMAQSQRSPRLLYREPPIAVRMIREEFNADFRGVMIDDRDLFEEIRSYAEAVAPALADRVTFYEPTEKLPMFERFHVTEQLAKVLDRKVWLPSGGSLIIEHTEALTVIDVNTGKNVGSSSLEETVFNNNMEAATEIARQLRLRDIGGIIVIDFVDMETRDNRDKLVRQLKDALRRDKTRTQVFPISELGLVEMTRKRIGEGLLESVAHRCEACDGRGVIVPEELLG